MAITRTSTSEPPEAVWAVLADGWRYAEWVVGCRRIRAVDPGWPAPGTRFHHELGVGPLRLRDHSESLEVDEGRRLVLRARAWPAGEGRVTITITPEGGGGSLVEMEEHPTAGLAKRLDSPPVDLATHLRNEVALRRLARAAARSGSTGSRSPGPS